jgi:OOP family OmpA-OmpF porin
MKITITRTASLLFVGLLIAVFFAACATQEEALVEEDAITSPAEETVEAEMDEEEVAMAEEPDPSATVVMRDSDGDGVPDDQDQCPGTPAGVRVDAVGCPKTTGGMVEVQLTLEFDFDSYRIRDEYVAERYKIDEFMAMNPDAELVRIDLDGHTCNIGRKSYNYKLSRRRADAVQRFLIRELNIGESYFNINAYGEDRPVASNNTKEGRRRNRRVDVVFVLKNVEL